MTNGSELPSAPALNAMSVPSRDQAAGTEGEEPSRKTVRPVPSALTIDIAPSGSPHSRRFESGDQIRQAPVEMSATGLPETVLICVVPWKETAIDRPSGETVAASA